MENASELRTYTKKERGLYLTGLTGQNIIFNVNTVLLASFYLQNVLYIPAMAVSVMLTVGRIWDGLNDPIMGTIVDRTRTKWGKCRPFLMFAPIPIGIVTMLTFVNFQYNTDAGLFEGRNAFVLVWAFVTYLLWDLFYTVGDIPLWGITALMTENEKHRQKLQSAARICGTLGGGVAMLGLQPLALGVSQAFEGRFDPLKAQHYGFIAVAVGVSFVSALLFQMAGFAKEKITPPKSESSIRQSFRTIVRNKPFRQIMLSGILGSPRSAMMIVAMPIVTYYYASKNPVMALAYLAFLGGGLFAGNVIATGLTPRLLNRFSKKNVYNFSNLMVVLPNTALFFLYLAAPDKMTNLPQLAVSFLGFVINGVSLGMNMAVQTYMVADAVDYEEHQSGARPDGVFFSGQTFLAKVTGGIAQIIYGVACTIVSFSDKEIQALDLFIADGGIPREVMMTTHPQYLGFMTMLFFIITIPSAIGGILACIPTWHYALDDREHKRILAELNEKRHLLDVRQ